MTGVRMPSNGLSVKSKRKKQWLMNYEINILKKQRTRSFEIKPNTVENYKNNCILQENEENRNVKKTMIL